MTSIIDRYPMDTLRQMHASMWMASRDVQSGKISADEFEELREWLRRRMGQFERGSAKRHTIKSWLMSTAAGIGLTNQIGGR